MHMKIFQVGLVRHIVDGAKSDSARSLDLLRAIEDTVDTNDVLARTFAALAGNCASATESICALDRDRRKEIDADGAICTGIESAIERLTSLVELLATKHAAALADRQLRAEDGVASSYEATIKAIRDACVELDELKWAVMENDADLSPLAGGPFKDVELLLSALRA
jgi:hypothetical protein